MAGEKTSKEGRKEGKEKRKRERKRERKRTPVKSPRGTRQRFASLYPWSKPFLFSPSRAERLCLFLPIHSRLLVDRFSFVIPFAAARENVPAKWERVSTRYNAQHVDNFQINFGKLFAIVSPDIAKTIFYVIAWFLLYLSCSIFSNE